jgi:hypothetical protein
MQEEMVGQLYPDSAIPSGDGVLQFVPQEMVIAKSWWMGAP